MVTVNESLRRKRALLTGVYTNYGAGMNHIRAVRQVRDKEIITPKEHVGYFGIITDDGREMLINWTLGKGRNDRRHGYISEKAPYNKYCDSLFESMFKGWN